MCRTKKIIAAVLCAIVAGIGVIGINAQTADAQTAASQGTIATAGMSLEQLQQIIDLLKQQIQQIIVLLQKRIAQSPVCGNGICETAKGETAANCPKDCVKNVNEYCVKEGMKLGNWPFNTCCAGLTPNPGGCSSAGCAPSFCHVCGNGICSEGENQHGCPEDCGCGNGKCEIKENQINCPADCGNVQCALEYWPCWTSSAPNPFGTDFAPKQCCAGLTCQMGAISGTCVRETATCAKEGETFTDANRQCCAGLVKTTTFISSDSVENITGDATVTASAQRKYICVKPPVITGCTGEGETISASKPQCCEGLVKIQRLGTNPSGGPEIAWSYYTCEKPTAINCAKEGEKIYPLSLANGRPTQCCAGLTAISSCAENGECPLDGSSICTYCGNGVCETAKGETATTCAKDCAVNWTKCSSKDTAEDCKKNGGHYFSAMGGGSCLCPGKPCYTNGDCDEHSVIPSSNAPKYCRFPDGKCVGPGECVINLTLDGRMKCDNYHPVCGCDGKSYASGCDLEKLNLSKKSEGECNASKYCANEGEYAALNVTSGTRYGCCNGLSEAIKPKGILCYSPLKGEPDCFYGGTAQEGWYYKPVATGKTAKLLLYEKCIIDD